MVQRKGLKTYRGQRLSFTGIFVRFGTKRNFKGYPEKTVLLKDVRTSGGEQVTDHLWFNYTKGFEALKLIEGVQVSFDARVQLYKKGYRGRDIEKECENPPATDYKLSRPTKIKIVTGTVLKGREALCGQRCCRA